MLLIPKLYVQIRSVTAELLLSLSLWSMVVGGWWVLRKIIIMANQIFVVLGCTEIFLFLILS